MRLTNFKYSGSDVWTLEVVKCNYLGITCKEEMDSFDMEDELVNRQELRRLNECIRSQEKLRKYLERNILPLVIKKIEYTRFIPQFGFFLSHKSNDKPLMSLMRTFRNGLKFLQARPVRSTLNKYNIEITEKHGLSRRTGFRWLRFTFDYALENDIEVRLTSFKYSGSDVWTLEVVKRNYRLHMQ